MAISATSLTTDTTSVTGGNATTASVDPADNSLVLIGISVYNSSSGSTALTSVTGNGITYALVASATALAGGFGPYQLHVYRGMAASPSAGVITIDPVSTDNLQVDWSVIQVTGAVTTGTNGADAVVQNATNNVNNGAGPLTVTLAAFADAGNGAVGFMVSYNDRVVSPGSGWSEIADATQQQAQWRADNDTTCDWTWTGGNDYAAGLAVEVAAAGGGGTDYDADPNAAAATASGPTPGVTTLTRPYVLTTIS